MFAHATRGQDGNIYFAHLRSRRAKSILATSFPPFSVIADAIHWISVAGAIALVWFFLNHIARGAGVVIFGALGTFYLLSFGWSRWREVRTLRSDRLLKAELAFKIVCLSHKNATRLEALLAEKWGKAWARQFRPSVDVFEELVMLSRWSFPITPAIQEEQLRLIADMAAEEQA